jgi:hypothetical protein
MSDQSRRPLTTPPSTPPGVRPIEVTAGYSIKVNVGNYEHVESTQFVKAEVDPNADYAAAQQWANEQAKYAARAAVLPALAARDTKIESIWNSLPEHIRKEMENKY